MLLHVFQMRWSRILGSFPEPGRILFWDSLFQNISNWQTHRCHMLRGMSWVELGNQCQQAQNGHHSPWKEESEMPSRAKEMAGSNCGQTESKALRIEKLRVWFDRGMREWWHGVSLLTSQMMFLKKEDKGVEERTSPVLGPAFGNSFKILNVNLVLKRMV